MGKIGRKIKDVHSLELTENKNRLINIQGKNQSKGFLTCPRNIVLVSANFLAMSPSLDLF